MSEETPRRKPGRPPKVKPEVTRTIPRFNNAGDYDTMMRLYRAFAVTLQQSDPNVQKVDATGDEFIAFINRCRGL